MDKVLATAREALAGLRDGMTVLVGGFSGLGHPATLIQAVIATGVRDLTLVNTGTTALYDMIAAGQARKVITSFAGYAANKDSENSPFAVAYRAGRVELELTSQGALAERIRAGGAGIPAFYARGTLGSPLGEHKPRAVFDGIEYVLERAIRADYAIIAAHKADRYGNLVYRRTHRNFNGPMATAAEVTVAEVDEIVPVGTFDPDTVQTSGVYVRHVVLRGNL